MEKQLLYGMVQDFAGREEQAKLSLARRIVANEANAAERHKKGNRLMSRSIGELEEMVSLMGLDRQPLTNTNFNFGPTYPPMSYMGQAVPGPTANADMEVEVNDIPLINTAEQLYAPGGDGYGASERLLKRLNQGGAR